MLCEEYMDILKNVTSGHVELYGTKSLKSYTTPAVWIWAKPTFSFLSLL
jgi:hypothetical protein